MDTVRKFLPIISEGLGERQIMVIASAPSIDRVKDIMVPEGCLLENYQKNPIVLWNHDANCPVGNAQVAIKNGRVEALVTFAPAGVSEKADEICALAKSGVLNTASVGFNPIEADRLKEGGFRFNKWDLMELSIVTVPAQPDAVVIGRSLDNRTLTPDEVSKLRAQWKAFEGKSGAIKVKGLYDIACLAQILCELGYLHDGVSMEADWEQDNSAMPKVLGGILNQLGDALIALTQEEVGEMLADREGVEKAIAEITDKEDQEFITSAQTWMAKIFRLAQVKAGRMLSTENETSIRKAFGYLSTAVGHVKKAHGHLQNVIDRVDGNGKAGSQGDDNQEEPDTELAAQAAHRKRLLSLKLRQDQDAA